MTRRFWRLVVALAFVTTALAMPSAVPVAHAADGLEVVADTTYRVDIDDAVVRVRIDVLLTNRTPDKVVSTASGTATTRYYFNELYLWIHDEGRSIRATSGGSSVGTSIKKIDGSRRLTVRYSPIYYQGAVRIRIEYDLPGGAPRSSSDIRVGAAFATFTAWAWGDEGKATVRIVMPKGFTDAGYGDPLTTSTVDGRTVLAAEPAGPPFEWFAVIVAERPSALTNIRIGTPSEPIVIHAWPDDRAWRARVAEVLSKGVPALKSLIGLEWPVAGTLDVYQVHTPLLEGYAGFYDPSEDEIRMSEDLDPQVMIHEAAHAWFDGQFVDERWITEGLAETYSEKVLETIESDGADVVLPSVSPSDAAAFPLDTWPEPSSIDDEATDARETFGYDAAWTVMRQIVREVGDERMREVFSAIEAQTIPYRGEGEPEVLTRRADARRFLDLVEEVGGARDIADLYRTWVLGPFEAGRLDDREAARARYGALDAEGGSWAVPEGIRRSMAGWSFESSGTFMDVADEVLAARDALRAVEARLGRASPSDIEHAYQDARAEADLVVLTSDLEARAVVASGLIATREAMAAERTPLVAIGLLGELPTSGFDAGLAAYGSGDLDGATSGAATSMALLTAAEAAGQGRLIATVVATLGVILLLFAIAVVIRRQRRDRRLALVAAGASTTLAATSGKDDAPAWTPTTPTEPPTPTEPAPGADLD